MIYHQVIQYLIRGKLRGLTALVRGVELSHAIDEVSAVVTVAGGVDLGGESSSGAGLQHLVLETRRKGHNSFLLLVCLERKKDKMLILFL